VSADRAPLQLLPPAADGPAAGPEAVPDRAPPTAVERRMNVALPPPAARRSVAPQARRLFVSAWVIGCLLIDPAVLLAPATRDGSMVLLVVVGLIVMAPSGVGLGCVLLIDRSRASLHAALGAGALLAIAAALVPAAHRIGVETYFAAHQVELDALAAGIRAVYDREPAGDQRVVDRFGVRLREAGVTRVERMSAGLLFVSTSGGTLLLYADGAGTLDDICRRPTLRAMGGRWYAVDCPERNVWVE